MRKKICGIVLLVIFLMGSVFNVFAFDDVKEGKTKESIDKLTGLEILKGYEDGTFRPDEKIKRSEFVAIINRVLGVSQLVSGTTNEDVFSDVSSTHWAAGDIKYAVSKGLILGYGNNLFGPEDNVTYEQAFKIIFNAIGYEYIAQTMGSYPQNYVMLAGSKGIANGLNIKFADSATRENICYILYEAMQLNIYEQSSFGGDISYEETDKTLLSELLRMKENEILAGIIIENHITSLTGDTDLEKGQVVLQDKNLVNHTLLTGETNASQFLGKKVEVYLDANENLTFPKINKITEKENSYLEVDAEDITNVMDIADGFKIEYEEDKKVKNISTKNLKVIYNGKAIENPTKDNLTGKIGTIKFVGNDTDTKYDVAFIECTYSFMVDKVSTGTKSIFLKDFSLNGSNRIALENENDDNFTYTLKDDKGFDIELSKVEPDDIVTVRSDLDNKNVDVVVSKKTIKGNIQEHNGEDDKVTIEGKEYKLAKTDQNQIMIDIDLQKTRIYYLDINDKVVAYIEDDTLIENVGYVIDKSYKAQSAADTMYIKVIRGGFAKKETDKDDDIYYITGNKDVLTYKFADKVRFNGVTKSFEYINNNMPEGAMVSYGVDKDGKISKVDIILEEYSKDKVRFNPEIAAFGGGFYLDDKTVVVSVPTKKYPSDPEITDEDYYVNVKLDSGAEYEVVGYDIDNKTKIAKFVAIKTSMRADVPGNLSDNTEAFIVTGVTEKMENDEVYCVLAGYEKGQEVSLKVKNDSRVYTTAAALKKGDVIFYSINSQNLIDNIVYVESLMPKPEYFHKNKRVDNEMMFGRLLKVERNELMESSNKQQSQFVLNIESNEDATPVESIATIDTKDMPVIYELNSQTGKVRVINIEDLLSVEEAGFGRYTDGSEVFICKKDSQFSGIIVIK